MPTVDAYLSDYLLVLAGVLGGNVIAVSLADLLESDLPGYLGIAQSLPEFLPPILAVILANLLAAVVLSVLPAVGVLAVLIADYRARPGE